VQAGRICGIVSTCIMIGIIAIYGLVFLILGGAALSGNLD
jgi:hypothetical protein